MKVAYYSNYFGYKSGSGRSAIDVLFALERTFDEVFVITYSNNIKISDPYVIARNRIKWICVPRKDRLKFSNTRTFFKELLRYIYYSIQAIRYRKNGEFVKKLKVDLLLINSIGGHQLLEQYRLGSYNKSIFVMRGTPTTFDSNKTNKGVKLKEVISMFEYYDMPIFVSRITQDKWESLGKIKGKKGIYIPNCADEAKSLKLLKESRVLIKRKLNIPNDKFNVAFVANIQFGKGHDVIIKELDNIINLIPEVKIHFIGAALDDWAKSLKRESKKK